MTNNDDQALKREQELLKALKPDPNVGETPYVSALVILTKIVGNQSEKCGTGVLQVLQNRSNHRYRILVRKADDLNTPLLNSYILPKFKLITIQNQDKQVRFNAINYTETIKEEMFNVRFLSPDTCKKFREMYLKAIQTNSSLLQSLNL